MVDKSVAKRSIDFQRIITYIVQLVVISLLFWYLYENRSSLVSLNNIRWQHIIWIVLLDTTSLLLGSLVNYYMIQKLNPRIGFLDCFMLQYMNNLLNKILPTIGGGAAFRAHYLKKVYHFPYTQFASTVAGLYVISFCTTSLIGILCLLVIFAQFRVFNWIIFLAFVGILLVTLGIIVFLPKVPDSNKRVVRILKKMVDSWNVVKGDPKLIIFYMLLVFLTLFISAAYSYVGYLALGVKPSPIAMLYLSTLGIIMAFLNFTPDGIGVKEGIYIFSKDLVQIPQDILVLGSLYLRTISIVTTSIIGGISYWLLMRKLKKAEASEMPSTDALDM